MGKYKKSKEIVANVPDFTHGFEAFSPLISKETFAMEKKETAKGDGKNETGKIQ